MYLFERSRKGCHIAAAVIRARASGINVDHMRSLGTTLSTVIASVGIIVYSQSFGFMSLYMGPQQMGFIAASAILIGGASITKAKVPHVILGTFLFQVLALGIQVANAMINVSGLSEVIRILISNGIILYALTQAGGRDVTDIDRPGINIGKHLKEYVVTYVFLFLSVLFIIISGLPMNDILFQIMSRMVRNLFIVLSLIIPIITGMGINFAITIGAMAAQVGMLLAINWSVTGITGILVSALITAPLAGFFGFLIGSLLNKMKGQETIGSLILGYFANGAYRCCSVWFA